jgi:hypothetical protein
MVFRGMERRASAARPYNIPVLCFVDQVAHTGLKRCFGSCLTTMFWVPSRIVGAVFDRQPVLATVFRVADRRASAARPYNIPVLCFVDQVAHTGLKRCFGSCLTTMFWVPSRIVGAVFDRQPVLATVFRIIHERASAASPYNVSRFAVYWGDRQARRDLWADGGRAQLAPTIFRVADRRASAARPYSTVVKLSERSRIGPALHRGRRNRCRFSRRICPLPSLRWRYSVCFAGFFGFPSRSDGIVPAHPNR